MRVLDLFCGAGLVADGLISAGCEVVGVDLHPQPRYPGPFIQADATTLDQRFIRSFDAVWASPPCLRDTVMSASARREQRAHGADETRHPDLISPTRAMLRASGLPYVIENVVGAELIDPVTLCGSMFGLGVTDAGRRYHLRRHRQFETNWPMRRLACAHQSPVVGIYGAHARVRAASAGGRTTRDPWEAGHNAVMRAAMGVFRPMTCAEVSQGIPPAYAEFIAIELRRHLNSLRQAA
ncbi:hypothetical protein [Phenylobacterium sp.]|uniref:hypothetical protein n=1 Tax=Phenylobacterium sp. TaxID=1871053 RepID=UPI001986571F|nr:hypothetical protein [Phenylobacterium sp.]MBC7169245.1 DNA cytosine methyltransferase [Phenylobacterium sp.]